MLSNVLTALRNNDPPAKHRGLVSTVGGTGTVATSLAVSPPPPSAGGNHGRNLCLDDLLVDNLFSSTNSIGPARSQSIGGSRDFIADSRALPSTELPGVAVAGKYKGGPPIPNPLPVSSGVHSSSRVLPATTCGGISIPGTFTQNSLSPESVGGPPRTSGECSTSVSILGLFKFQYCIFVCARACT